MHPSFVFIFDSIMVMIDVNAVAGGGGCSACSDFILEGKIIMQMTASYHKRMQYSQNLCWWNTSCVKH